MVHENEPRHWHDDAAMAHASERAKKLYFQCAREQMAPYHNVMHTFSGSVEVFPGVTLGAAARPYARAQSAT